MNNDYISRQALFDAYEQKQMRREPYTFEGLVKSVPIEDVVPVVHGKWIYYKKAHYFKCSQCKETVPYKKAVLIDGERKYNYCPKCSTKMDG